MGSSAMPTKAAPIPRALMPINVLFHPPAHKPDVNVRSKIKIDAFIFLTPSSFIKLPILVYNLALFVKTYMHLTKKL